MGSLSDAEVVQAVQERYAAAARTSLQGNGCGCGDSCCGGGPSRVRAEGATCCGDGCCAADGASDPVTGNLYDADAVPSQRALAASLGCGNPTALVTLEPGQMVLDLGSGGGLDVLLSARRVAPGGHAYGVDMTDEMLQLAQRHQTEAGVENATFLKGSIEELPMDDSSVDVVISNCVINLSTDKDAVLREAYRVLRPGGRFAVADIVLLRPLEERWSRLVGLWTGCIAGALVDSEYLDALGRAGFQGASVEVTRRYSRADLEVLADQMDPSEVPAGIDRDEVIDALDGAFASAFIRAERP